MIQAGVPDGAKGRRSTRTLWAAVLCALAAGAGLGWAGQTLLPPPAPLPAGRSYSVVTVQTGTLERALNLSVATRWSGGQSVRNSASGVLTQRRVKSGAPVNTGDVIYTVNLEPVIIASGAVPAFRSLQNGVRGADVTQLQALLVAVGVRTAAPDGVFGQGTAREVRTWQRELKVPVTGEVPLGRVVFLPGLPGVLAWADGADVGGTVSPGSAIARVLPPQPRFTLVLPASQRTLVERGMTVVMRRGSQVWKARLGQIGQPGQDGSAQAELVPVAGANSICLDACSQIPIAGDGSIDGQVIVVPKQQGQMLPSAALAVAPSGATAVITDDGQSVPVTVKASAGGRVLVEGVSTGQAIRVPGRSTPARR